MRSPVPQLAVLAAGAAAVAALSGCTAKEGDRLDLATGKKLFVQKCGACHTLSRAGTKGTVGPNLDQAFQQDLREGFGASAVRGVVRAQIAHPRRGSQMPAGLVKGDDASDVAAYIASVAGKSGKDQGLLATIGQAQGSSKPALEAGGKLTIPADPGGQLAFVNKTALGKPGRLTIDMPNKSGVQHNIAIQGKGAGKIVANGVSSFTATFAKGTYTYFCEVPGHREGGMVGKLTIK